MGILIGTPVWVWGILGYLVYVGVQALKPRTISLNRLIIMPIVFIAFKYRIFAQPNAWIYFSLLTVGIIVGYLKVRKAPIKVFKESKTMEIPGSSLMIILFISIFVLKFYAGYLQATNIEAFNRFEPFDFGFSGLLSGYFSGQRFCFLRRYFQAKA